MLSEEERIKLEEERSECEEFMKPLWQRIKTLRSELVILEGEHKKYERIHVAAERALAEETKVRKLPHGHSIGISDLTAKRLLLRLSRSRLEELANSLGYTL